VAATIYLQNYLSEAKRREWERISGFLDDEERLDASLEEVRRIRGVWGQEGVARARQGYWGLAFAGVEPRLIPTMLEEAARARIPEKDLPDLGYAWLDRHKNPRKVLAPRDRYGPGEEDVFPYAGPKRFIYENLHGTSADNPKFFTRRWIGDYVWFRDHWPQPYEAWRATGGRSALPDSPELRGEYAEYLKVDPRPPKKYMQARPLP
jgi:hypothetical protein